jgi:hypothetical protein
MKKVKTKQELIALVQRILDCEGSEGDIDVWLDEFQASVPHPAASDLIYYDAQERTAEEIVDLALAYRPLTRP